MAMKNLDLEEQEQLETLRDWWKDNGNLVVGLVAAVIVGFAGWYGWNLYQRSQAAAASGLYEALVKGAAMGDAKVVRDTSGTLTETHSRSLYASMAALVAARFHFDRSDAKAAKAQLQWVIDRTGADDLRDIARLRLAALLQDEKAYDEALKLLDMKHAAAFEAQFAAARGDVLVAKNQAADAKAAYKLALEKTEERNETFRASVQLRLDALGG